jgi:hypothetical protein
VHDVPRRIDVVIIVAGVAEHWTADLPQKTGRHQRCGQKATHLFLLLENALAHRRPNNGWSTLASQLAALAEIRVDCHTGADSDEAARL